MRALLTGTALLVLFALCQPAVAQPRGIGVGAQVAASNNGGRVPVGLSVKTWLDNRQAISGATSFQVAEDQGFGSASFWILEANYLFHNFQPLSVEEGELGLYVGPGVQFIADAGSDTFAFRGPIGINYIFSNVPADLFVEIAPTLQITDPTVFRFDGAIGFRYFFAFEE